jgi:Lrp/AsnC family transcriptional regulator
MSDAKMNVKEIAAKLNITKTPIYERIKKYEKQGIIDRYVAVINREKVDHSMVVFCSVSLESQKLDEIKAFSDAVINIPEVMECYLMGGVNDFLLKVVVEDLNAYHLFASGRLAALANVGQIKSTFVLNEIKRSLVYPLHKE